MQKRVIRILLILELSDFSTMCLNSFQEIKVPGLSCVNQVLFLTDAIVDMLLKFLHINLELAVGTFGDVLQAVHQMQIQFSTVDLFGTKH